MQIRTASEGKCVGKPPDGGSQGLSCQGFNLTSDETVFIVLFVYFFTWCGLYCMRKK